MNDGHSDSHIILNKVKDITFTLWLRFFLKLRMTESGLWLCNLQAGDGFFGIEPEVVMTGRAEFAQDEVRSFEGVEQITLALEFLQEILYLFFDKPAMWRIQ